ncbi:hypothetical protein MQE01_17095, partial [Klebsiella sp. K6-243]|nr:hypothetical protein [Klebsiella sp. K6-243]
RVWRRLLENSLSAKVSCWLIRLLILGSGYNTMISHLGLIRTFLSVAPDTLVIPLSDEECENMNRERLTHFHSSKTADVIFNDTGKIDHKLSLPLPVNLAIQENDRRENSVKVAEKVSERLHITFKVPTWLIALIVVMIVINVIVLIVLHR